MFKSFIGFRSPFLSLVKRIDLVYIFLTGAILHSRLWFVIGLNPTLSLHLFFFPTEAHVNMIHGIIF